MTVREMIQELERFAKQVGDDAEFKLIQLGDSGTADELRVLPDEDRFDFEVLRGDKEVVVEFN